MTDDPAEKSLPFRVVLILGSFDPETKKILIESRQKLAQALMSEAWVSLVVLVDDVELYKVDIPHTSDAVSIIVEHESDRTSMFVVKNGKLDEAIDVVTGNKSVDTLVSEFVRQRMGGTILRLPVLEKVSQLANVMAAAFVIRHLELTRGGEYIELAFLIGCDRASSSRIWFFKREGIDLSQMAWEILDKFGVQMRPYKDENQLMEELVRVARYRTGS
jgi:hypothetical protein